MKVDCKCRYLCERCGGTGVQEDGSYDAATQSFTGRSGQCQLCTGEGYLGYIQEPPIDPTLRWQLCSACGSQTIPRSALPGLPEPAAAAVAEGGGVAMKSKPKTPKPKCPCPLYCKYCGRKRSRDTVGHYSSDTVTKAAQIAALRGRLGDIAAGAQWNAHNDSQYKLAISWAVMEVFKKNAKSSMCGDLDSLALWLWERGVR